MDAKQQRVSAIEFAETWKSRGDEKQESQRFWMDLLHSVFGVENPAHALLFEKSVKVHNSKTEKETTCFIDVYIPDTKVLIEQKGRNIDLLAKAKQSDDSFLTPFEQAKRYADALKNSERPRFIVTCNFKEFYIYDLDDDNIEANRYHILLEDLPKEYSRLSFLTNLNSIHLQKQFDLSVEAGNLVGKLYDTLLSKFAPTDDEEQIKRNLHSLNVLCVRLVFCLYAEDAELFNKDSFAEYLKSFRPENARQALINFFKWIDTKDEDRDPYADDKLKAFPYVNGGLFHDKEDEKIIIPPLDEEVINLITNELSLNFNWSSISPTIFGAVFESTLNPETRRSGGMHYTSLENIHKVIDPLFLDDLKAELARIKEIKQEKKLQIACDEFQQKLSKLVFLDPAAGSGNFLTETYLSLRKLENEVFLLKSKGMVSLGAVFSPILVTLDQFYGIEINDFAVSVAKTALWIAQAQSQSETEKILNQQLNFFPLNTIANYYEGNALRMNWEDVVPKEKLTYIIGNPPFVGHQYRNESQKKDLEFAFYDLDKHAKLDYVCGWYNKAADLMHNSSIKTAFVSTNSICQGESVGILWKHLSINKNIEIIFAYPTFVWNSQAKQKAKVHVVIVGMAIKNDKVEKSIFLEGKKHIVKNINGYLKEADDIYIEARSKPLSSKAPIMTRGSQPTDGGFLIISQEELDQISSKNTLRWIKRFMMGDDYINNKKRYCLWLENATPQDIKNDEFIYKRVQKVLEFRKSRTSASAQKDAMTPHLFTQIRQPKNSYLVFPRVSSERRKYVPIGFLDGNTIIGDKLQYIETDSLSIFGMLTSSVHMAWFRTVGGRLKSDYSYSNTIVYNNFPWCTPTDVQKAKIEKTAQGILDARAQYPESSLADLYDEFTMPIELRKAHQANDIAVLEAYGFDINLSEEEIVSKLFELYISLAKCK